MHKRQALYLCVTLPPSRFLERKKKKEGEEYTHHANKMNTKYEIQKLVAALQR